MHKAFLAQEEAERRSQLGLGDKSEAGRSQDQTGRGSRQQQAAAGATSAAHEAMDALKERGEKIGVLKERVAELDKEAEDFYETARKLREQQQRRWF